MSVAWVAVGATVVGAAVGADSSRHAVNTQKDIANQSAEQADKQLDAQVRQADELLAFNKQQYEEGKVRQAGIDEINKKVVDQNLGLMEKAGQRADESYDFYKTNGRPLVEKTLNDANNFDSQGNIDAARGRAAADVQQAADNSEQQGQRALTRMGVNPSSGRFLALQQRMQADKQLALAGAETNAEQGVRTQAIGLRQQASNLAQGFPAQSLAQGNQSSGTGVAAAGVAGAGGAQSMALTQQSLNAMNAGAGIYGNAAQGYNSQYNIASNNANNAAYQANQNAAGWGNLAGTLLSKSNFGGGGGGFQTIDYGGMATNTVDTGFRPSMGWANGGKIGGDKNATGHGGTITGPGTGTSDDVKAVNQDTGEPVRLSNGEYVISADTVRALGTKYFDNLQRKHHTPVGGGNLRRAA